MLQNATPTCAPELVQRHVIECSSSRILFCYMRCRNTVLHIQLGSHIHRAIQHVSYQDSVQIHPRQATKHIKAS